MGNRAVITFSKGKSAPAIYLHWNGGLESVLAFLQVCKDRGYRDPVGDPHYALARLIGVIHEFFDGGDSLGVGRLDELDVNNWDNGAYLVGEGWSVQGRFGKGSADRKTPDSLDAGEREKMDGIVKKLQGAA